MKNVYCIIILSITLLFGLNVLYAQPACTFTDNFEDGIADGWSPLTPSRWQVSSDAGSLRYFLNTTNYESPDGIRMGELSLLSGRSWSDFTFECLAKSADAANGAGAADLCIAFGYQDFDSYYYINFNSEPGLTQLFRIHNGSPALPLATYGQATFKDGNYHALRIERNGSQIRAFFDGQQILSAVDSFFGEGLIGVGSYNDSGYFDNVMINCPSPQPELVADRIYLRTGPNNSGNEINNPVAGQAYYLYFDWRNTGGQANNFLQELRLNNAVVCGFNTSSIPANSSQTSWCDAPIIWPTCTTTIVIEGALDVNHVLAEPDENNNVVSRIFACERPNLTATAFSFSPASANRGGAINLSGTVTNNGIAPTGSSFRVNCFLSTSPNAPDLSLTLTSFVMPALNAGQSSNFNQIGTVPSTVANGFYYVWVRVDHDNAIAESNENDNNYTATTLLTVIGPPPPGIKPTGPTSQSIGTEFGIDVMVTDVTNLFGVGFELNYNSTYLSLVGSPTAGDFLGNDVVFVATPSTGKISFGISRKAGQSGSTGSGVVARARFTSSASTSSNTQVVFTITSLSANDPNGAPITLTPSSHFITLTGCTVWPGDTNNDGVVNQTDVLPLGLYWSRTGPARSSVTCFWAGQPATCWTPLVAMYADANGDGVVNQSDVLCIGLNWGRTHTTLANMSEGKDNLPVLSKLNAASISLSRTGDTNPGQDFWIEVVVEQISSLFGISFEVVYSPTTLADPQSAEAGSFIGNDVIFFPNFDKPAGKIGIGVTRKMGQSGVNGSGAVARIRMRVASQAVRGQVITFTLQNVAANDSVGQTIPLSLAPASTSVVVSVTSRHNGALPTVFALYPNVPNPFNPSTEISYDLPEPSDVRVDVYDVLGQHVRKLVHERQQAGSYSVTWDGRNDIGQPVTSGVFIYQLRVDNSAQGGAGKFVQSRRMLLLR